MFGATSIVHGVLGTPELDLASYTELRMRRNPAFVFFSRGNSALPQLTAAGALVELASQMRRATFSSWEDDSGCSSSSCGDNGASIRMHLVPGTDDHTESAALTYAVYLGVTSDEAATTTTVERFGCLEDRRSLARNCVRVGRTRPVLVCIDPRLGWQRKPRTGPVRIHVCGLSGRRPLGPPAFRLVDRSARLAWNAPTPVIAKCHRMNNAALHWYARLRGLAWTTDR